MDLTFGFQPIRAESGSQDRENERGSSVASPSPLSFREIFSESKKTDKIINCVCAHACSHSFSFPFWNVYICTFACLWACLRVCMLCRHMYPCWRRLKVMSGIFLNHSPPYSVRQGLSAEPRVCGCGRSPLLACSGDPCLYFLKLEVRAASTPTGIYISSGDLDKYFNQ